MKKIAHIQLLPMLSGVQKVTLQELMILNDNEYTKYLICKEEGELTEECKRLGIKTHVVKDLTREINAVKDIIALYKIYKFLKANDIDIVHTHSAKTGFLGRVAAKLAGIPLIVHTVHGFPFDSAKNKYIAFFYKVLEFISARFADIIICLHDGDKETCKKLLHVPESKVLVLPNGIAFTEFFRLSECDKKKARTILGIPESSLVFTMVGRLWEQKNPLLILFGNGYKNQTGELVMEMEVPAILCNFGIIGFILYLGPFIFALIYGMKEMLKNKKEIKIDKVMYLTGFLLAFALSSLSGYVFFNLFFLPFVLGIFYKYFFL